MTDKAISFSRHRRATCVDVPHIMEAFTGERVPRFSSSHFPASIKHNLHAILSSGLNDDIRYLYLLEYGEPARCGAFFLTEQRGAYLIVLLAGVRPCLRGRGLFIRLAEELVFWFSPVEVRFRCHQGQVIARRQLARLGFIVAGRETEEDKGDVYHILVHHSLTMS